MCKKIEEIKLSKGDINFSHFKISGKLSEPDRFAYGSVIFGADIKLNGYFELPDGSKTKYLRLLISCLRRAECMSLLFGDWQDHHYLSDVRIIITPTQKNEIFEFIKFEDLEMLDEIIECLRKHTNLVIENGNISIFD